MQWGLFERGGKWGLGGKHLFCFGCLIGESLTSFGWAVIVLIYLHNVRPVTQLELLKSTEAIFINFMTARFPLF